MARTKTHNEEPIRYATRDIWPGQPYPMGAHYSQGGVNFALYSEHAYEVELLLFQRAEDGQPRYVLSLPDRTGPVWHGFVPGLKPGQLYGYRVYGPFDPERGHRFNHKKVALDPYARALGRSPKWGDSLFAYPLGSANDRIASLRDNAAEAPLGVVLDNGFDWQGDRLLDTSWEDTVIYETHVKGISKLHPGVAAELRGTYLGLASEPIITHLQELGVTAVQLLPVHAKVVDLHLAKLGLTNYWGYNSLSFFAPEPSYASQPLNAVNEFKEMVRRLHQKGLEVIIDVVYNHTGEGNHLGPTLSFRGIDNRSYYKLHPEKPQYYMDYTGTGNTLDVGNPYVLQLIMDSLRYWVQEMHVDGFRFDLASALAREFFDVNMLSSFFKIIQQDPLLSRVKLIAEPWDVGYGGYQVGNFPWHWAEWNGKYRDTLRSYWRGDKGKTGDLATRLAGSSDLYARSGRKPYASVNFITAHDGFTLEDLVSYTRKHNYANGEDNRDGHDDNLSINFGVEGPSEDGRIMQQRDTLKRSLISSLLLSQGVPMLLGGDELSRSQQGNNNAYCQDNELNWYHWDLDKRQKLFLDFVKKTIHYRKYHPGFRRRNFLSGRFGPSICKDVSWWHPLGHEMTLEDWLDQQQSALGMLLCGSAFFEKDNHGEILGDDSFLLIFHGAKATSFTLPPNPDGQRWQLIWGTSAKAYAKTVFQPATTLILEPYAFTLLQGV